MRNPKATFTSADGLYMDAVALGCFPRLVERPAGSGVGFWACQCMDRDHAAGAHSLITPGALERYRVKENV